MHESINGIMITLQVDSEQSLFILLAADGTVKRLGTGSVDNTEKYLCMGGSRQPLFDRLYSEVDESWFDHQGASVCYCEVLLTSTRCLSKFVILRQPGKSYNQSIIKFI